MIVIKYVLRIELRMSPDELREGDDAIHGEEAYVFGLPLTSDNQANPPVPPPAPSQHLENGGIGAARESDTDSAETRDPNLNLGISGHNLP